MKKYFFSIVALATCLASCTSDVEDAINVNETKSQEYILTLKPFEFDDATRVKLEATANGITFKWNFSEVFGVFPINPENGQVRWNLNASNCEDEDHYAKFRGAGWGLQEGVEYAAYHPYQGGITTETRYTDVPVSLPTWQEGTLDAIGSKYDYIWATKKYYPLGEECIQDGKPKNSIVFDFSHAIAIIKIILPEDAVVMPKNDVYIWFHGYEYITEGKMDASTGKVTSTKNANELTLKVSKEDGKVVCYLPIFPTTINGKITLNYNDGDGGTYLEFNNKEIKAGKAYRWTFPKR